LTSTFAEVSPGPVGDYDVAYDIWLNKQANEVMIWLDTYKQVPAGDKVATAISLGGRSYDVWVAPASGYLAYVPTSTFSSGTIDILAMLNHAITNGWLPASPTLGQINLGVEVCSTDDKDVTWYFDDFSVTVK